MSDAILFHTDLYRRDALEAAAEKYRPMARVEIGEEGAHVVARLLPLSAQSSPGLLDEFCNEAFSNTAKCLRTQGNGSNGGEAAALLGDEPPWDLLAPFGEGDEIGLGWVLESLSPVRGGAVTVVLRHPEYGIARVNVRRNGGAPLGVAHTDRLDFMLMNGGGGTAQTEASIATALTGLADTLRARGTPNDKLLEALQPHSEGNAAPVARPGKGAAVKPTHRIAPHIEGDGQTIVFDFSDAGISRLALYDAILRFADRCYVFMTRPDSHRICLQIKPRGAVDTQTLRVLTRDITNAVNLVARQSGDGSAVNPSLRSSGLPKLVPRRIDMEALLAELDAGDPKTLGVGFQPERGPGHENLRVLNIRGTGACNSECIFCIEKFNPTHRPMPNADTTRQFILDGAGRFDMLFFASGEPTIHPKLFEYVELARSVGFTCFGMSSHFRTFADPRFALKTLQAGFEYFDIALHAADDASQLEVNPIDDGGHSLWEALKGLAILFRLADALGIRISVTQKIVVSRLNVTQLEEIFRATYDRGVRHFILQPVRSLGLAPERQAKLEISEEEILPYLNELLRKTEGTGAVVKPYGFSRQQLFDAAHVESEQNRVKNIYGKARQREDPAALTGAREERPTDGRHWVEVRNAEGASAGFASDGKAPILDTGLDRDLTLSFGCRMGSCGMCCAKLIEGKVDQSTQIFLSDEQMEQGYVLLCQARPLSDVVVRLCTNDEIDEL